MTSEVFFTQTSTSPGRQPAAHRLVMAGFIAFLAILGAGFDLFIIGDGEFFAPVATSLAVAIGAGSPGGACATAIAPS